MGDRCSIYINIHGPIETVEALETILEALETDGLSPETQDDAEAELFYGIGEKFAPQFGARDCLFWQPQCWP
jgi:coenzyme F420-reducing hydrogenase alpha subunit